MTALLTTPVPVNGLPDQDPSSWASSVGVRRSMLSNRSEGTTPERRLLDAMRDAGLRFVPHAIPLAGVRRRADAVFVRAGVCVFMDGCLWHGCPEHYREPKTHAEYWIPKIRRNRERDEDIDLRLRAAGLATVRVWEHELRTPAGLTAAVARVSALVNERRGGTPNRPLASLSN